MLAKVTKSILDAGEKVSTTDAQVQRAQQPEVQ